MKTLTERAIGILDTQFDSDDNEMSWEQYEAREVKLFARLKKIHRRIAEQKYGFSETNFYFDELDGKYSIFKSNREEGTQTVAIFTGEDLWLYPKDLGTDNVVNVFTDEISLQPQVNVYDLPDNWRKIVTNDSGADGKPSILDIMIERD